MAKYSELTGYSGFQATVDAAFATYSQLTGLSGYSATVINLANTGSTLINEINSLSGNLINDISGINSSIDYITGIKLNSYATLDNLSTGLSGVTQIAIGYSILNAQIYTSGLSGYVTNNFYSNNNPSGFININQTGAFYASSNPSGFITGVDLSSYALKSQTGSFVTAAQTGAFYAANNPSGFITGVDLSAYALSTNLSTTGQQLKQQINSLSGSIQSNYVAISGSTMTGNLTVPNIIINSQSQYCSGTTVKVYQYYNTGTNSLDTVFV